MITAIRRFLRNVVGRFATAGQLLAFFWHRKIWWMTPLVLAILVVGVIVILGHSSVVSAFIYSLF